MPQSAAMQAPPASSPADAAAPDGDPAIEALRGWAALMVLVTHYAPLLAAPSGAWGFASTGVDLFFVLSGAVFAPYLFGRPLQLLPHLIRRFFRLYPLYLCALLLYAALRLPAANAWEHFGTHLVMGHTLQSLELAHFYNAAFWSLPPELEYYLLLPLLAWCATRIGFGWLLAAATAMHLLLVAAASPGEGVSARAVATIHAPGLLVEFMLGSLAYALAASPQPGLAALWRLLAGLLVLAATGWLFASQVAPVNGQAQTPPAWIGGNIGMAAALGYALVVSALTRPQRRSAGWFTPGFVLMGQLSYGVYLFHNAAPQLLARWLPSVTGAAAVLVCTCATLLAAWAAHRAVERPLRRFGRALGERFRR